MSTTKKALKKKRFFLSSDVLSTIALNVPSFRHFDNEYEVTMRDCSRQIHWLFPTTRAGLAKAKKVAKFFTELAEGIELKLQEGKKK